MNKFFKRTPKKLPNFRYYRNEDNMKTDKFCWLEWKFVKGPGQCSYLAPVESSFKILYVFQVSSYSEKNSSNCRT